MRTALVLFFILCAPAAHAALIAPSLEVVGIHISPKYPEPGERVVATVSSTGNSGDFAYEWTVDGEVVAQGFDAKEVVFEAGPAGSQTEVSVRLIGALDETRGAATRVIQPASVDIVWEGNTYTPPFYAGLPLVSGSASFTALAIPHLVENGRRVSADAISYAWSTNGQPVLGSSGKGRSSITTNTPFYNSPFTLSVLATTPGGAAAQKTVSITPVAPLVLVYENKPLWGIDFAHAVSGSIPFIENEKSFRAYPFFASDPAASTYAWGINGIIVTDAQNPRSLVVQKQSSESGIYTVTINFEDVSKLFEKGVASFDLSI